MQIKEFIQSIYINQKSKSQIQTLGIYKNKSRAKIFIGSVIIITCAAFHQSGTKAQFQQEELLPTSKFVESIPTSPITKKENFINAEESRKIPSIYPVAGKLTDAFGVRANPFGGKKSEIHFGLDIAAPNGTPVSATADGIVAFAGWQRGYGNIVIVDHGSGLTTRYAHLSRINTAAGRTIERGTELGKVGSTGRSTGSHLHYEVRAGNHAVDPSDYLPPLS